MQNKMSDIDVMIEYMQLRIRQRDWHGVSDAANDIREMEAESRATKIKETDHAMDTE